LLLTSPCQCPFCLFLFNYVSVLLLLLIWIFIPENKMRKHIPMLSLSCKASRCLAFVASVWNKRGFLRIVTDNIYVNVVLSEQKQTPMLDIWRKKAIPETGSGGLKACEMLRIPYCLESRQSAHRWRYFRMSHRLQQCMGSCQAYIPQTHARARQR
jgi:hypothetical protein